MSAEEPTFVADIRPLFTDIDVDHMSWFCDLSKYEDVRDNTPAILGRLKGETGRVMPPPRSGGPWDPERIALFERWIAGGCKP